MKNGSGINKENIEEILTHCDYTLRMAFDLLEVAQKNSRKERK